jgi:hypothetical protein
MAGGRGWMSLGTTIKSLPRTRIAPALFAVPERPKAFDKCELYENKLIHTRQDTFRVYNITQHDLLKVNNTIFLGNESN